MAALAQGTKVGSVFIDVKANADQFRAGMARAKEEAVRAGSAMTGAMRQTEMAAKGLHTSLLGVTSVIGALAGAGLVGELISTADAFSLMRSRIRLVTQAGEDMLLIEKQLTEQALNNRAALKPTIDLYTRLRQARADINDETAQLLVDRWSKSLIISASSASEAANATLQFSQAMALGVLQGQDLKSIMSQNSAFAVYLAKGLGVSTGALRQMGEEGKLSLDVVIAAIKKAGDAIDHDFGKKAITVHQALTNIETAFTRWIGLADQGAGASRQLANWLNFVAHNFDVLAAGLLAAVQSVVSAVAIGALMSMVTALGALAVEMRRAATAALSLDAAMKFLGGPWGIAIGAIVAALLAMNDAMHHVETATEQADRALENMASTYQRLRPFSDMADAAESMKATGDAADKTLASIRALNEERRRSGEEARADALFQRASANIQTEAAIARLQTELDRARQIDRRGPIGRDPSFGAATANTREQSFASTPYAQSLQKRIDDLKAKLAEGELQLKKIERLGLDAFKPVELAGPAGGQAGLGAITEKQLALELARARNQDDLARKLEDEVAVLQLTASLQDKGLTAEKARERAIAHVAAMRKAINASEAADTAEKERQRQIAGEEANLRFQVALAEAEGDKAKVADLETQLEINRRAAALEEQGLAAEQARARAIEEVTKLKDALHAVSEKELAATREMADLEYQLALATAQGADQKAASLQRELDIRREMKSLMDAGFAEADARTRATTLVDARAVTSEDVWAKFGDNVSEATKQGLMDAVQTGDWGKALGDVLTDITRKALSNAIDVLFEALSKTDWGKMFGGGDVLAGIGALFGGSPAGAKAGGGPVEAGRKYRVGELGSEWFYPKTDGVIIPHGADRSLEARPFTFTIGDTILNVNGLANGVTVQQLAEVMEAHRRAMPVMIDARVQDRLRRGAY